MTWLELSQCTKHCLKKQVRVADWLRYICLDELSHIASLLRLAMCDNFISLIYLINWSSHFSSMRDIKVCQRTHHTNCVVYFYVVKRHKHFASSSFSSIVTGKEICLSGHPIDHNSRKSITNDVDNIGSIHCFDGRLFTTVSMSSNVLVETCPTKLEVLKVKDQDERDVKVIYLDSDVNNLFALTGKGLA